jgi:hypothetical protein
MRMVNVVPHEHAGCSSVGKFPLDVFLGRDNTDFTKRSSAFW